MPWIRKVYADDDAFWADLVAVYHQELAALAEAGATFVQFDECPCIMMADPQVRKIIASKGGDAETLINTYLEAIKAVLQGRPEGMRTAIHLCRGNYKGQWIASGGYDGIAERLFSELDFDAYYLEYDSERAGDFAPLRFLAPGKTVVLGLVNSKRPRLETAVELTRRIDEAARHVPLEQLAISPQCGFASSVGGNPLTIADQTAKLRRLVEVAERIQQRLEVNQPIRIENTRTGEVVKYIADTSKARDRLNFAPKVPLSEGVKKAVAWYQEHIPV